MNSHLQLNLRRGLQHLSNCNILVNVMGRILFSDPECHLTNRTKPLVFFFPLSFSEGGWPNLYCSFSHLVGTNCLPLKDTEGKMVTQDDHGKANVLLFLLEGLIIVSLLLVWSGHKLIEIMNRWQLFALLAYEPKEKCKKWKIKLLSVLYLGWH